MKFRKFLYITMNNMFTALGKSVTYQAGIGLTTDYRIFLLENQTKKTIEENLESVMENYKDETFVSNAGFSV